MQYSGSISETSSIRSPKGQFTISVSDAGSVSDIAKKGYATHSLAKLFTHFCIANAKSSVWTELYSCLPFENENWKCLTKKSNLIEWQLQENLWKLFFSYQLLIYYTVQEEHSFLSGP